MGVLLGACVASGCGVRDGKGAGMAVGTGVAVRSGAAAGTGGWGCVGAYQDTESLPVMTQWPARTSQPERRWAWAWRRQ